jgi:3-dehydroquinate synthase
MVKGRRGGQPATDAPSLLPYPIIVESGILDKVGEIAKQHLPAHSYAIITDDNVGPLYGQRAVQSFGATRVELITMPHGEVSKNVQTWWELSESLLRRGFGRDSGVIALGGGITGDVAGFVAATFMRGVPYIQVPTTVVAMVDSSIGGKTGVNTTSGKNLLGAFHQPRAVLADPQLLLTLPPRELRAGMAEVIKHGAIADAQYFARVRDQIDDLLTPEGLSSLMPAVIAHSVTIKSAVVAADERESGMRKILNFGHTIGHAIEALSEYRILHGEAIAIGMCLEARVAEHAGIAAEGTTVAIEEALKRAALPTDRPAEMSAIAILEAAATDKKARKGEIEFALPSRVGQMAGSDKGWSLRVPRDLILSALN